MRLAGYSLLVLLILSLAPPAGLADELRVATWNLEHLDDSDGECCSASPFDPPKSKRINVLPRRSASNLHA